MGITAAVCQLRVALERHFPKLPASSRDPRKARKIREARLYFDIPDQLAAVELSTRCYRRFGWFLAVESEKLGKCLNPAWLFDVRDSLLELRNSVKSPDGQRAWAELQSTECFESLEMDEMPAYAERMDADELPQITEPLFCLRITRIGFDEGWLRSFDKLIESEARRVRCDKTSIWLDGRPYPDLDPQYVAIVEVLEATGGRLKQADIVEQARKLTHPVRLPQKLSTVTQRVRPDLPTELLDLIQSDTNGYWLQLPPVD